METMERVTYAQYTSWWDECLRYSRGCYQQLADHDRRQGRAAWYAFAEEVEYTFDGSMKVAKVRGENSINIYSYILGKSASWGSLSQGCTYIEAMKVDPT